MKHTLNVPEHVQTPYDLQVYRYQFGTHTGTYTYYNITNELQVYTKLNRYHNYLIAHSKISLAEKKVNSYMDILYNTTSSILWLQ